MMPPRLFKDDFFDDMFGFPFDEDRRKRPERPFLMRTDILDLGQEYQLAIEIPGFSREEISAELKEGYLTIKAKHTEKLDQNHATGQYIRRERYLGECKRSFFIGKNIKQEDVKAKFKDGILTLLFPKNDLKKEVEEKKFIMIE